MARTRKLTDDERRALLRGLHDRVEQGGHPWSDSIRQIRQILGLTQAEFGKAFRMTRRQVLELEAGKANPTVETLTRIGRAFGFEVGYTLRAREPLPGQAEAQTDD